MTSGGALDLMSHEMGRKEGRDVEIDMINILMSGNDITRLYICERMDFTRF